MESSPEIECLCSRPSGLPGRRFAREGSEVSESTVPPGRLDV